MRLLFADRLSEFDIDWFSCIMYANERTVLLLATCLNLYILFCAISLHRIWDATVLRESGRSYYGCSVHGLFHHKIFTEKSGTSQPFWGLTGAPFFVGLF